MKREFMEVIPQIEESYVNEMTNTIFTIIAGRKPQMKGEKDGVTQVLLSQRNMVFFSWGPHNFKRLFTTHGEPALRFSVNGMKFSGEVTVIYNRGLDLFDVEFENLKKAIYEEISELYIDELQEAIDRFVERK